MRFIRTKSSLGFADSGNIDKIIYDNFSHKEDVLFILKNAADNDFKVLSREDYENLKYLEPIILYEKRA